MATKPSQPALYEKMRTQSALPVPISPKVDVHPQAAPSAEAGVSWLGPGRAIRLPSGYVLLACGIGILLLSFAYMTGHKRGAAIARGEYEKVIQTSAGGVSDPLGSLTPVLTNSGSAQPATVANNTNRQPISTNPTSWGAVSPPKDPRQKGLNYFIIAETNEQGAKSLAEFCRSHGLETYVVMSKNDRRRVIAYPGFEARDRTSAQVRALEAKIHSVGDLWKKNKGSTDFRDAYPSLYNG
jgi:hypothetical protein